MEKIQDILFENKKKIPDGLYLELMNSLKIEHDKTSKFYKCKYTVSYPSVVWKNGEFVIGMSDVEYFTTIIDINDLATEMANDIKMSTPFTTNITRLFPCKTENKTQVRHNHIIYTEEDEDQKVDDDYLEDDLNDSSRIIYISSRFNCEPRIDFISSVYLGA